MNVTAVRESDWDKDGTIVKVTEVTLEDGSKAPGYDLPQKPEIGKPLPDGWEFATGKSGKPYIKVPKAGKGAPPQAAYRNTKEGQAYEQERMDRRTALMQAVEWGETAPDALQVAEAFYTWLRATSGAASIADRSAGGTTAPSTLPGPSAQPSRDDGPPASLPASEHLAGVNGAGDPSEKAFGEGAGSDSEGAVVGAREGTTAAAPSQYLTREEQKVFAKAFGGQVAAVKAARERFGDRIRGLDDLTREMATELVAAKVGG